LVPALVPQVGMRNTATGFTIHVGFNAFDQVFSSPLALPPWNPPGFRL